MTIREMYESVLEVLETGETAVDKAELTEMVRARLEKHIEQTEKRKTAERKPTAKQLAAQAYDAQLLEALKGELTDEFLGRMYFAEALEITGPKVSALMKKLVAEGIVEKGEVKGEKGKQVGYRRVQA